MSNQKTTETPLNAEKRETPIFEPNHPIGNLKVINGLVSAVIGRNDNGDKETLKSALYLLDALEKELTATLREKALSIRLLKNSKVKDGKRYDNLYLQVRDGNPIAIKLSFDNFKVKNMLLAIATPCEIRQTTIVRELDGKTEY